MALTQTARPQADTAQIRGDISGTWQGTLNANGPQRIILRIAKEDKGWNAKVYLLADEGTQSFSVSGVALDRSTLKFSVDLLSATYEGILGPDGNSVAGSFSANGKSRPLALTRATKETEWEIRPPQPSKAMAPEADPSFEVATIKPDDSGATTLQSINVAGRQFETRASSLFDLISYAYGLHAKQIVGAPDWVSSDRYDVAAVIDQTGDPSPEQLKSMVGKLLTDRFALQFHHEARELSVFVLSVGKSGPKLSPSGANGGLPGLGYRPGPNGLVLRVQNGSMKDFAGFLQAVVLDRPVVDQTGLTGRFDFVVPFTPDDSQFNGHPPKTSAQSDSAESAPNLFQAIQQIGLKLIPEKTSADVVVLDHVGKPSPN
jgi:uncharacterized protein (TIGR03435 family)